MSIWDKRPSRTDSSDAELLARRLASCKELENLSREGRLWAIVDACDEPGVPTKMDELGEQRAVSLYRGDAKVENADIAPYLAHVDDFFLQWIREELWAKPWGIFVVAPGEIEKLRTHFRKFLTVKDPDGEKMYFRYYDPRILKAFLPACNEEELQKLFGPLEAYVITEPDSEEVTFWTRQGAGPHRPVETPSARPRRRWG